MNMNNLRYPGQWYVLTCAICLLLVPVASARFRVTDLGTIGTGTNPSSVAYGINNTGTVVGFFNSPLHAFRDPGVMLDLGTLGGATSYAFGVNDHGQVVGSADTLTSSHAFLYAGTTMSDLGTLGGAKSTATAINAGGWVAGYSDTSTATHAFLFHNGVMNDLGTLGGISSFGYAIDVNGRVVGSANLPSGLGYVFHPFLYNGLSMLDLGGLGGNGYPFGINNAGVVVGSSFLPGNTVEHAYFWNGLMHDLGTLGSTYSRALAINNHGAIVGEAAVPSGYPNHGFIAYCQNRMVDINPMTDASGAGWTIMSATAINDAGQVAAWGQNSNGEYHALLLTFLGSLSC
jgi:probable HAF family extracellular repeat protein